MTRWFSERARYLATLIGFKLGCLTARVLPGHWLLGFGDALAELGFLLFRGYRTKSMSNLKIALPDQAIDTRVIARRSLRNFFRACIEILIALESTDAERRTAIPLIGKEHLDAALAKGNGVIILSAHLGNFFLLGTRLAMEGHRVHVLIHQPKNGRLAKLMDHYGAEIRLHTIHARPRPQALREISAVLRANGIVIIIADEYRKGSGVPATLFGRTVLARRGPVTLAARTGAAIVPACVIRQPDDSLKLIIEPELNLVRFRVGPRESAENVLRMTHWLEKTVRTYPDQWNWMNIRWWIDSEGGDQKELLLK
ncbi:MAG TPA: lysophospholipid acyltransferase family protein [Candidatus Binatia bacterium]|nr:lysophospholipid acyltransferase family protein [Candidatus Binatia bacterium]